MTTSHFSARFAPSKHLLTRRHNSTITANSGCGPGLPEATATTAASVRVQQQLTLSLVSRASTVTTAASVILEIRSSVVSCLYWEAVVTTATLVMSSQPPRSSDKNCGQPEATATTVALAASLQRFTFSDLGRHRRGDGRLLPPLPRGFRINSKPAGQGRE
eukprot:scaffold27145_cov61-Phaeocystis_antarctica.AAC.6